MALAPDYEDFNVKVVRNKDAERRISRVKLVVKKAFSSRAVDREGLNGGCEREQECVTRYSLTQRFYSS